jgi:hypothetical protein
VLQQKNFDTVVIDEAVAVFLHFNSTQMVKRAEISVGADRDASSIYILHGCSFGCHLHEEHRRLLLQNEIGHAMGQKLTCACNK